MSGKQGSCIRQILQRSGVDNMLGVINDVYAKLLSQTPRLLNVVA